MTKEVEVCDFDPPLKECPFCGGKVYMSERSYLKRSFGSSNYSSSTELVIRCDNCGLQMLGGDTSWKMLYDCEKEINELIEKWNRRA